jgi:energy-converting hydrogenase Eha subunit C
MNLKSSIGFDIAVASVLLTIICAIIFNLIV